MYLLTNTVRRFFCKNIVWSMALYTTKNSFSADMDFPFSTHLFDSKKIRFFKKHPRVQADPFMMVHESHLYIFFEIITPGEVGKIAAYKTKDLAEFDYLGIILSEPYHLSFPFLFRQSNNIFLLPESSKNNELTLYKFKKFPFEPVKIKTLLHGRYVDSFIVNKNEVFFLFTTSDKGLEIFFSENISEEEFIPHPKNPICVDPIFSRSGGGPLYINGELHRVAQDCSSTYGKNLNLIKILELSKISYSEILVKKDIFTLNENWNQCGSHHLSLEFFKGQHVIMVDGKQNDYFANKVMDCLRRIYKNILRSFTRKSS